METNYKTMKLFCNEHYCPRSSTCLWYLCSIKNATKVTKEKCDKEDCYMPFATSIICQ